MLITLNWRNGAFVAAGCFFVYLFWILWGPDGYRLLPNVEVDLKDLISYSILAAQRGGMAVKKIHYEQDGLAINEKGKTKEGAKELLTRADLISNALILETLQRYPGVKVVSEEKKSQIASSEVEAYRENPFKLWNGYKSILDQLPSTKIRLADVAVWVDPLDATQEYTESLTQYVTTMVCVVVKGEPWFGVIYRPFDDQTVCGYRGNGVFTSMHSHLVSSAKQQPANQGDLPNSDSSQPMIAIVSRSHSGTVQSVVDETMGGPSENGDNNRSTWKVEPAGGAGYKVLRVLNETAQLYVHVTAIKKWDVCAGNAIIEAGGGQMTNLLGDKLTYFPQDSPLNDKGLLVTKGNNHFTYLTALKKSPEVQKLVNV